MPERLEAQYLTIPNAIDISNSILHLNFKVLYPVTYSFPRSCNIVRIKTCTSCRRVDYLHFRNVLYLCSGRIYWKFGRLVISCIRRSPHCVHLASESIQCRYIRSTESFWYSSSRFLARRAFVDYIPTCGRDIRSPGKRARFPHTC